MSQGVLWIFGGLTNGAATNKVEGYDPTISTWESGPSLPLPLHHVMAVVYRGDMVVMGGWVPSGSTLDAVVSNRVFALRNGRVGGVAADASCACGGRGCGCGRQDCCGGRAGEPSVGRRRPRCSTGRVGPMSRRCRRRVITLPGVVGRPFLLRGWWSGVVGGQEPRRGRALRPGREPVGATSGVCRHRVVGSARRSSGNRLVTIGGESPTSVFNTVEVLDLTTNTWTTLPAMKTPRHGLAVARRRQHDLRDRWCGRARPHRLRHHQRSHRPVLRLARRTASQLYR